MTRSHSNAAAPDVSPSQLVRTWTDLMQAYAGCHPFGGDTAEIYAYTLLSSIPSDPYGHERPQQLAAAANLETIILKFMATFECQITINGLAFRGHIQPFDHRLHVRVRPRARARARR